MTRVLWGDAGNRFFETGVDRGVLYLSDQDGVPWNGLTSVEESPSGGEARPYYQDGVKFLNVAGKEEFEATIEAFSAPAEFGVCDGTVAIQNGLFVTQQPRRAFSLSYRTMVGNDLDPQMGYKIHLVYNALAGPASRTNATMSDSPEALTLSWGLTTLPPAFTGYKPTAHLVIDSRKTPKGLLKAIEDILYGSDAADARIPMPSELITMFQSEGPTTRKNWITNPTFRDGATSVEIRRNLELVPAYRTTGPAGSEMRRNYIADPRMITATGWASVGAGGAVSAGVTQVYSPNQAAVAGEWWSVAIDITAPSGNALVGSVSVGVTSAGSFGSNSRGTTNFNIPAGTTQRISNSFQIPVGATPTADGLRLLLSITSGASAGTILGKALMEKTSVALSYFDGTTAAADGLTYGWSGTADNSASIASGIASSSLSTKGYSRAAWTTVGAATDGSNTTSSFVASYNTSIAPSSLLLFGYGTPAAVAGDTASARFRARLKYANADLIITPRIFAYTSGGAAISAVSTGSNVTLPATGEWVDVLIPGGVVPATAANARIYVNATGAYISSTAIIEVSNALVEKTDIAGPWFDGSSAAADGLTYSWLGTANASESRSLGARPNNYGASNNLKIWKGADGASLRVLRITGTSGFVENTSILAVPVATDDVVTLSVDISSDTPADATFGISTAGVVLTFTNPQKTYGPTPIREYTTTTPMPAGATYARMIFTPKASGVIYTLANHLGEKSATNDPYFDGSSVDSDNYFYYWDGTPDASSSHVNTWN